MERKSCETTGCNNLARVNGYKKNGDRKFYRWCSSCCKVRYRDKYKPPKEKAIKDHIKRVIRNYGGYVKLGYCELCKFIPKHRCQLDVDHIDGNHSNNSPNNLQTLCANCHRYKTWKNNDVNKKPQIDLA